MNRCVNYRKTEFLVPWTHRRRADLHLFILAIPYGLYDAIVPSRDALNEVLSKGRAGGGMGTGLIWEPFSLTDAEYTDVIDQWRALDWRTTPRFRRRMIPEGGFIFDDEILAIPYHLDYLRRSRAKYPRAKRPCSKTNASG